MKPHVDHHSEESTIGSTLFKKRYQNVTRNCFYCVSDVLSGEVIRVMLGVVVRMG